MSASGSTYETLGLNPGDVLEFASVNELVSYEDAVAQVIAPIQKPQEVKAWEGRRPLEPQLYPQKHKRPLHDIRLTVMDKPYSRLSDAHLRGWKLPGGKYTRKLDTYDDLDTTSAGFVFSALAKGTSLDSFSTITTELWCVPTSPSRYGAVVKTMVAEPHYDVDVFRAADAEARRIGMEVLRFGLKRPYKTGMRD